MVISDVHLIIVQIFHKNKAKNKIMQKIIVYLYTRRFYNIYLKLQISERLYSIMCNSL